MVYFGLAYIQLGLGHHETGLDYARKSLSFLEPTGAWELYVDQGERAEVVCKALREELPNHIMLRHVLEALKVSSDVAIPPTAHSIIQIQTFGTFRVFRDGAELEPKAWVSIKAKQLLAYFVTVRHERIPMERAIDAVWQDGETNTASNTAFHTALYRLRQALRRNDEKLKFVLVESGNYRLDISRFDIDADRFQKLIERATKTNDESLYRQAIDLYKGQYLGNFYYDWALQEAQHLAQVHLQGLERLRKIYAQSGQFHDALEIARLALKENRFLEVVHQEVMIYLKELGDRQGVVRQYELLTELLKSELSSEPLPETKSLYERLLRTD